MQNCQVDFTCDAILELVAVAHSLTEPEKNKLYVIATLVQICIRGVMCDSIARLMKQTIQTENWTFLQSASGANIINDSNLQHFAAAFLPRHLIPFGADVTYLLNDFRILQRTALCLRFYLPLQNLTSNRVDATWNVKPPTHPNGFSVPVHHNTRFAFVFVVVDVTSAPIHLRVARRMYTMKLPELFSKCAHRVKHMRWFQQSATQRNESGKWKKFCDFLPFVWARPPASWEKCCACALRCSVSAVFFSRFDA